MTSAFFGVSDTPWCLCQPIISFCLAPWCFKLTTSFVNSPYCAHLGGVQGEGGHVLYCTVLYCTVLYCTVPTLAVSRGKVAMSAMQAAVPAVASCPNNPGRAGGEP